MAVSPNGLKVYVANMDSNTVSVIDTATNTVSATVTVGSGPVGVAVSPNGLKVYVANWGSNTVSVINTATNAVTTTVGVGDAPGAFGNFIGPALDPEPVPTAVPTLSQWAMIGLGLLLAGLALIQVQRVRRTPA